MPGVRLLGSIFEQKGWIRSNDHIEFGGWTNAR